MCALSWGRLNSSTCLILLPPRPLKHIRPLNISLPAPPRQCRRAVHHLLILNTHHPQLRHSRHKRPTPRPCAERKCPHRNPGQRVIREVLVGRQCHGRSPIDGLGVELVVPLAGGGVHGEISLVGDRDSVAGCGVCANEGRDVYGGEATVGEELDDAGGGGVA
jgi:hypothetical protein